MTGLIQMLLLTSGLVVAYSVSTGPRRGNWSTPTQPEETSELPVHLVAHMLAVALAAGSDLLGALRMLRGQSLSGQSISRRTGQGETARVITCTNLADGLAGGLSWEYLWRDANPELWQLSDILHSNWTTGASVAPHVHAWAEQRRVERERTQRVQVMRVAVLLVLPLGLLLLPAFVLIAIVPMILSGII